MSDHDDDNDPLRAGVLNKPNSESNPRILLHEMAQLANELKATVFGLSSRILPGEERRAHILAVIESISHPVPLKLKLDLPADIVHPSCLPRTVIGLSGDTGSGKSTLLSSILGIKVSPTSLNGRGTAFPTIIMSHPHDYISASLTFMSLADVLTLIDSAFELIKPDDNGRFLSMTDLRKDPSYAFVSAAFGVDKQYLEKVKEEDGRANIFLQGFPDLLKLLGTTAPIKEYNEKDFANRLQSFAGSTKKRKGPNKWALLTSFLVCCKSESLSANVILVDMPGYRDCSPTVLKATADIESRLDVRFVAVTAERVTNHKVVNDCIDEEIARRRTDDVEHDDSCPSPHVESRAISTLHATLSGLAVIMTQCDALARDEDVQYLENDGDIGPVLDDNEEFQSLAAQISEAEDEREEKKADLEALDELEARLAMDGGSRASSGLKRTHQHSSRSTTPKRAKLEDGEEPSLANPDSASEDDCEDVVDTSGILTALSNIRSKRNQVLSEMRQLEERIDQYKSRRRILAWRTRYSVTCADLRRLFGEKVLEATRDAGQTEDGDMTDDSEDFSLPIFVTGAKDFNNSVDGSEPQQQTGILALREFIYHLGARAENQAVLDLLQPFRTMVQSTVASLTATDRDTMGESVVRQKLAAEARWTSDKGLVDPNSQSRTLVYGEPSAAAIAPGQGIQDSLNAAFAKEVERKLRDTRGGLEVVKAACEKGVKDAINSVRGKAQSLVNEKMHWGKHRAVIKHHGQYGDIEDYNAALAEPLMTAVKQALVSYRCRLIFSSLRPKLIKAAESLFHEVHSSMTGYDTAIVDDLQARISHARTWHLRRGLHRLEQAIRALLSEERNFSRPSFFSMAVSEHLQATYDEAAAVRGPGSIALMKVRFVDAVEAASKTMFHEMTEAFIKRQTETLRVIETRLFDELALISRMCELEISNVWVVPDSDKMHLEARAAAAMGVDAIARRLLTMETELVQEMQRAEKDVPTCHPAP
ncbi:hypothetical protein PENSPDRAFT_651819 [Peniophora sp. CONT]|nr:hypothetical protein PENSPDRAFT_651819 [Peniophora sp. CONT]